MEGDCEVCPLIDQLSPSEDIANDEIEWCQRSTNEECKADKIVKSGTVSDCFGELKIQLPQFLLHTYVKRTQAAEFQQQKESTNSDLSKIVIQIDFAENYSTVKKDEIQSAYWATNQITVFTCCAWAKTKMYSLAIISDYLSHDKYAVAVFLNMLLAYFRTEIDNFDKVVLFSDGATSQFKQKYILDYMTHFENLKAVTWNFFATSHGKGAVDGVGGVLKRLARTQVLSGGAPVDNSEQFAVIKTNKIKTSSLQLGFY